MPATNLYNPFSGQRYNKTSVSELATSNPPPHSPTRQLENNLPIHDCLLAGQPSEANGPGNGKQRRPKSRDRRIHPCIKVQRAGKLMRVCIPPFDRGWYCEQKAVSNAKAWSVSNGSLKKCQKWIEYEPLLLLIVGMWTFIFKLWSACTGHVGLLALPSMYVQLLSRNKLWCNQVQVRSLSIYSVKLIMELFYFQHE